MISRTTFPRDGTTHHELSPTTSIIKKNLPQACPQASLVRGICSLRFPLPNDSNLYLVGPKLASTPGNERGVCCQSSATDDDRHRRVSAQSLCRLVLFLRCWDSNREPHAHYACALHLSYTKAWKEAPELPDALDVGVQSESDQDRSWDFSLCSRVQSALIVFPIPFKSDLMETELFWLRVNRVQSTMAIELGLWLQEFVMYFVHSLCFQKKRLAVIFRHLPLPNHLFCLHPPTLTKLPCLQRWDTCWRLTFKQQQCNLYEKDRKIFKGKLQASVKLC